MSKYIKNKRIRIATTVLLAALLAWVGVIFFAPEPNVAVRAQAAKEMLERVRETRILHPVEALSTLPLPEAKSPAQRKALFIAAMLEPIARENARILKQRARVLQAPQGGQEYAALAQSYGLHATVARTLLLSRIDIVPASLTLAQGAIESAWGTSRFAQEGNAFFGERTYDEETPGLTPVLVNATAQPFKVKSFSDGHLSVRSFMYTLNTHPAYRAFRQQRAALRAEEVYPTGLSLAPFLHGYSEIGDVYIQRIVATIHAGDLGAYDDLRLAGEPDL